MTTLPRAERGSAARPLQADYHFRTGSHRLRRDVPYPVTVTRAWLAFVTWSLAAIATAVVTATRRHT